jgi:hypothetical protein
MRSGTCTTLEFYHKTFCAIAYIRCYKLVRFISRNFKLNKMANAIKKYDNGLSIRYIKKSKAYFITFGVAHIKV